MGGRALDATNEPPQTASQNAKKHSRPTPCPGTNKAPKLLGIALPWRLEVQDRAARHAWFKSVVLPHEAALRRHVRRLSASGVDIDDIISEALIRAYTSADYTRIDNGRAFLFAVARNLLIDLARRRAVVSFDYMADLDKLNLADGAPSAETVVSARDEVRRLQQIVDALPPQCRRVFVMRRIDDLDLEEIAARLSLSVSTVEKHLSKAMALLTAGMAESDPVSDSQKGLTWQGVKDRR